MNDTPLKLKKALADCASYEDMDNVFKNANIMTLKLFVRALTEAEKYIELTMRDKTLLMAADMFIKKQ